MQAGGSGGDSTDQWRCYEYITNEIAAERPLRLMVQASAGTGKSFLTVERAKCLAPVCSEPVDVLLSCSHCDDPHQLADDRIPLVYHQW